MKFLTLELPEAVSVLLLSISLSPNIIDKYSRFVLKNIFVRFSYLRRNRSAAGFGDERDIIRLEKKLKIDYNGIPYNSTNDSSSNSCI